MSNFFLSSVVVLAPTAAMNVTGLAVTSNMFRHGSDVGRRAAVGQSALATAPNITVENVLFLPDQPNASFWSLGGASVVADNVCSSPVAKGPVMGRNCRGTRATRSLRLVNSTRWVVDLSDVLLPPFLIATAIYSVSSEAAEGGATEFARHVMRPLRGRRLELVVDFEWLMTATVTVVADQTSHDE